MSNAIHTKLAKLLRLARSPNPNEAKLARAMYERLSAKSGITVEDPDAHASGHSELRFTVEGFDLRHKLSASLVMLEYGIGVIMAQRIPKAPRTLFMVGPAAALEEALALFRLLAGSMEKGWAWFRVKPLYDWTPVTGLPKQRRSKVEFYQGMHHALSLRMEEARAKRATPRQKDVNSWDSMLALISGLHEEPAQSAYELATVGTTVAQRDSLNRYAQEAFPGITHETVHIEHTDTVSYQQGCRYGLTVPLRDCAAIAGISL